VHAVLKDLLPAGTYFRFNPIISTPQSLDAYRDGVLDEFAGIGRDFVAQHSAEIKQVAAVLRGEQHAFYRTLLPPLSALKPYFGALARSAQGNLLARVRRLPFTFSKS